jgi:hypothetical protein
MSWADDSPLKVSKPFPPGKITFNNHLPTCANEAQAVPQRHRVHRIFRIAALQKYMFTRGSHLRKALLHPARVHDGVINL